MAVVKGNRRRRRRYAAPIGGISVVLFIIGLVAVVVASILLTVRALDNSGDLEEIERVIRPIVMFDPAPFEKVVDISEQSLLEFSLWSALSNNDYTFNSNNELAIPASDLDVAALSLFGPEVALKHQTFGEFEYSNYYDEDRAAYLVNTSVILYTYTPLVESIEREGELYSVRVGYVPAQGVSPLTMRRSAEAVPDKYMLYVMSREDSGYRIVAVRDVAEGMTHMAHPGGEAAQ
ncbi:MAG: hypothetical protein LBU86_03335 [Oscillospiraceae bacterium]|jgi:hypothetical protein|nr:hypothetical protein [Oscillospiraceae bacterium]